MYGSPFEVFVKLEAQRGELYENFLDVDELDEIGPKWISLSKQFAEQISHLLKLTSTIYDRYWDEIEKISEQEKNMQLGAMEGFMAGLQGRKKQLMDLLGELEAFKFNLSIITMEYSRIGTEGIYGNDTRKESSWEEEYHLHPIDTITDVVISFFDLKRPHPVSIADAVKMLYLKMESERSMPNVSFNLKIAEKKGNTEQIHELIKRMGDHYRISGIFSSDYIDKIISEASGYWWWDDPLLRYANLIKAEEYWEKLSDLWRNQPGEMSRNASLSEAFDRPVTKSKGELVFMEHYTRLARKATFAGNHEFASKYYQTVEKQTNRSLRRLEVIKWDGQSRELVKQIVSRGVDMQEKAKVFSKLSLSSFMLEQLWENQEDLTRNEVYKQLGDVERHLKDLEIKDVSAVTSQLYTSLDSALREIKVYEEAKFPVDRAFETLTYYLERFIQLTQNNIADIWEQIDVHEDVQQINLERLTQYTLASQSIAQSVAFVPNFIKSREHCLKKVRILYHYTMSGKYNKIANQTGTSNQVLSLLLRGKAAYHSRRATQLMKDQPKDEMHQEKIDLQMDITYLIGYLEETKILHLVSQFTFVDKVLQAIIDVTQEQKLSEKEKKEEKKQTQKILEEKWNEVERREDEDEEKEIKESNNEKEEVIAEREQRARTDREKNVKLSIPVDAKKGEAEKKMHLTSIEQDLQETELLVQQLIQISENSMKIIRLLEQREMEEYKEIMVQVRSRYVKSQAAAEFTKALKAAIIADFANQLHLRSEVIRYYTKAVDHSKKASDVIQNSKESIDLKGESIPQDIYNFYLFCKDQLTEARSSTVRRAKDFPLSEGLKIFRVLIFSI